VAQVPFLLGTLNNLRLSCFGRMSLCKEHVFLSYPERRLKDKPNLFPRIVNLSGWAHTVCWPTRSMRKAKR